MTDEQWKLIEDLGVKVDEVIDGQNDIRNHLTNLGTGQAKLERKLNLLLVGGVQLTETQVELYNELEKRLSLLEA